jgi:predicted small lipoprotein YifL
MRKLLFIIFLATLAGCTTLKPVYFNDSDQVFVGDARTQPPTPTFEWILMSTGQYRKITTANPQ